MVVGVALVWLTNLRWLDPLVAVLVGLNILRTGYELVRESFRGLMGRADPVLLAKIVEALQEARSEGWIDIHHLRAWRGGDRTFVDFHLVVPEDWTVVRLHEAHDRTRDVLQERLGPDAEVIIHFDPEHRADYPAASPEPWSLSAALRVPGDEATHNTTSP